MINAEWHSDSGILLPVEWCSSDHSSKIDLVLCSERMSALSMNKLIVSEIVNCREIMTISRQTRSCHLRKEVRWWDFQTLCLPVSEVRAAALQCSEPTFRLHRAICSILQQIQARYDYP